jgi:hypothetical protein
LKREPGTKDTNAYSLKHERTQNSLKKREVQDLGRKWVKRKDKGNSTE